MTKILYCIMIDIAIERLVSLASGRSTKLVLAY